MNKKVFTAQLLCSWGLLLSMDHEAREHKRFNYMRDINEALIGVLNHPHGTNKQYAALQRARVLVQEAITVEGVTDNATLYAIGAIILDNPEYAKRSAELQKSTPDGARRTTQQLLYRQKNLADESEKYLADLEDQIEEVDMLLMSASLSDDMRKVYEQKKQRLEQSKKWSQAQSLSHGMLKEALYRYKNSKEEKEL